MMRALATSAAAALLAVGGCADTELSLGPTVLSEWSGSLAPVHPDEPDGSVPLVAGSIAALVRSAGTEAGIELQTLTEPDLTLNWGVYSGSCESPGALLGGPDDYTTLDMDNPEGSALLEEQLTESEAYHVSVADAETDRTLSCGNLVEVEM